MSAGNRCCEDWKNVGELLSHPVIKTLTGCIVAWTLNYAVVPLVCAFPSVHGIDITSSAAHIYVLTEIPLMHEAGDVIAILSIGCLFYALFYQPRDYISSFVYPTKESSSARRSSSSIFGIDSESDLSATTGITDPPPQLLSRKTNPLAVAAMAAMDDSNMSISFIRNRRKSGHGCHWCDYFEISENECTFCIEALRLCETMKHSASNNGVIFDLRQRSDAWDRLFQSAQHCMQPFRQYIRTITKDYQSETEVVFPPLKGRAKAAERVFHDLNGDWSRYLSLSQCIVIHNNFETLSKILTLINDNSDQSSSADIELCGIVNRYWINRQSHCSPNGDPNITLYYKVKAANTDSDDAVSSSEADYHICEVIITHRIVWQNEKKSFFYPTGKEAFQRRGVSEFELAPQNECYTIGNCFAAAHNALRTHKTAADLSSSVLSSSSALEPLFLIDGRPLLPIPNDTDSITSSYSQLGEREVQDFSYIEKL